MTIAKCPKCNCQDHRKVHGTSSLYCQVCGTTFSTEATATTHKETWHPGDLLGVQLLKANARIEELEKVVVELHQRCVNLFDRVGGQSQMITKLTEQIRGYVDEIKRLRGEKATDSLSPPGDVPDGQGSNVTLPPGDGLSSG